MYKKQKHSYRIFIFTFALIVGVSMQYFSNSKAIFSKQALDKLVALNSKYNAQNIESLIEEGKSPIQENLQSLLTASILDNKVAKTTSEEPSRQLLFKLQNTPNTPENIFSISFPDNNQNLADIAQEYQKSIPEFEFVEEDYEISLSSDDATTSESAAESQDETQDATQDAKQTTAENNTETWPIVAVIDTGTDIFHPMLRNKRWFSENEVRNNNLDDDQNGFKDDKYGWDFTNDSQESYFDENGHGTHISGIIAKSTESKIMPVKIISNNKGNISDLIRAIKYASDNGAEIINFSIGTTEKSMALEQVINYANDKGIILVAAAGNKGDETKYYPAAYDKVVAVGALDQNHQRMSRSNYGDWVEVYESGQDILSSLPGNDYGYKSGTSQAAAVATAKIARLKADNPNLGASKLIDLLKNSK